jgi:hypothetical protein
VLYIVNSHIPGRRSVRTLAQNARLPFYLSQEQIRIDMHIKHIKPEITAPKKATQSTWQKYSLIRARTCQKFNAWLVPITASNTVY